MPSLPPWATGPWVLLPYPGLVPLGGEGPHCGDKSGWNGGEGGQGSPHPLLPWGQGLTPLEGQRQEVETPGAGFFNWFYFNFYYIFSFSIKEPLPTLSLVSLLTVPSPPSRKQSGSGCQVPPCCRQRVPHSCSTKAEASIPRCTRPHCALTPAQCHGKASRPGRLGRHTKVYWAYLQEWVWGSHTGEGG